MISLQFRNSHPLSFQFLKLLTLSTISSTIFSSFCVSTSSKVLVVQARHIQHSIVRNRHLSSFIGFRTQSSKKVQLILSQTQYQKQLPTRLFSSIHSSSTVTSHFNNSRHRSGRSSLSLSTNSWKDNENKYCHIFGGILSCSKIRGIDNTAIRSLSSDSNSEKTAMESSNSDIMPLRRSTRKRKNVSNDIDSTTASTTSSSVEKEIEEEAIEDEEESRVVTKRVRKTKKVISKRKVNKSTSSASAATTTSSSPTSSIGEEDEESTIFKSKKTVKKKVKKVVSKKKVTKSPSADSESSPSPPSSPKTSSSSSAKSEKKKTSSKGRKTKVEAQRITDRDEISKLWDGQEAMEKHGSYTFKVISWNVAGLRAVLKNHPQALPTLATKYNADVICLQETKLQETHVTDPKLKIQGFLLEDEGFDSHYSCSTAKKGYSGTAVFVRRRQGQKGEDEPKKKTAKKQQSSISNFFNTTATSKTATTETKNNICKDIGDIDIQDLIPINISTKLGKKEHDSEGRIITVDFPKFSITNVYVPNSGQKLERLAYRTDSWDKDLLQFMKQKKEDRNTPVIWLGDLNVAHTFRDVWNDGAKHLAKQAGVTPEERASFQEQLDDEDGLFVDAFRHLFPDAKGHYSYWSQRAGNRTPNKGLRLDYFIASRDLFEQWTDEKDARVLIRDSYMIPEYMGSDHCPVVLEIEIKKP